MGKNKLPVTEELDFHYLLTLMPAMHRIKEFSWLPELFSIIGHEKLIDLCKYAGGETITIPTLEQLSLSIDALQWFYDVYITRREDEENIPAHLVNLVYKIYYTYYVRDDS